MLKRILHRSSLLLFMLLFYIPIFVMVILSSAKGINLIHLNGYSLLAFQNIFSDKLFLNAIFISIIIGLLSSLIATSFGFLITISLTNARKYISKITLFGLRIPIANADLFNVIGLIVLFSFLLIPFGLVTFLISHVVLILPYTIILIYSQTIKIKDEYVQSSQDLGANYFQTIFKIYFPLLFKYLLLVFVIGFALSFDDFIFSFLSSGKYQNIGVYIYTIRIIKNYFFALGTFILIVLIVIFLINIIYSEYKRHKTQVLKWKKSHPENKTTSLNNTFVSKTNLLMKKYQIGKVFLIGLIFSLTSLSIAYLIIRNNNSITVYAFNGYITDKSINNYEKSSKSNVFADYFLTNEEFFAKIKYSHFDVGMVSDYGTSYEKNKLSQITDADKIEFCKYFLNHGGIVDPNHDCDADNYLCLYQYIFERDYYLRYSHYVDENSNPKNLMNYMFPYATSDIRFLINNNNSSYDPTNPESPYKAFYDDSLSNKKVICYDDPRDLFYLGIKIAQSLEQTDPNDYNVHLKQVPVYNDYDGYKTNYFISFDKHNIDLANGILRRMFAHNNTLLQDDLAPQAFIDNTFSDIYTNGYDYSIWYDQWHNLNSDGRYHSPNYTMIIPHDQEPSDMTTNLWEDGFVLSKKISKKNRKKAIDFIASQYLFNNLQYNMTFNAFLGPTYQAYNYAKNTKKYQFLDSQNDIHNFLLETINDTDLNLSYLEMFDSNREDLIIKYYGAINV